MSTKNQGAANDNRSLALLWGSQTKAGRSGLTLKNIVAAAIEIADNEGLEALSMRAVAEKLGVGTMSLYTHVPGKTELIELMLDSSYAQLYESIEAPAQQPGDWRDAMRFIARRNWEVYHTHPWLLQVNLGRPVLGPHIVIKYEAELRPLDNLGLTDIEIDASLTLILTHVEGCARVDAAAERARRDSGQSDVEWWVNQAPLLDRLVDPAPFPVATRVGMATGQEYQSASNPQYVFEFGLERILAGIAALIAERS